jgi:hypothetical protein
MYGDGTIYLDAPCPKISQGTNRAKRLQKCNDRLRLCSSKGTNVMYINVYWTRRSLVTG